MKSDLEYIICKCKAGSGWLYSCFEPEMSADDYKASLKVHYQLGEPVPSRRRYICTHADMKSAEAACQRHWERLQGKGVVA